MADLQRKYYDPCIRVHIAEHATQVRGLLEMLAVLPVLWSFMALEDSRFAAFAAFVALEALQSRQDRWDASCKCALVILLRISWVHSASMYAIEYDVYLGTLIALHSMQGSGTPIVDKESRVHYCSSQDQRMPASALQ